MHGDVEVEKESALCVECHVPIEIDKVVPHRVMPMGFLVVSRRKHVDELNDSPSEIPKEARQV